MISGAHGGAPHHLSPSRPRRIGRWRRATAGGCAFRLLVLLVALGAAAALAWMALLPLWVTDAISTRTGCEVRVANLSCNPFTGRLTIRGLVLANPPGFPAGDFLTLREFRAEGELSSLLSGPITLDVLVLDVRRAALVRRADGRTNAELFLRNLGFAPAAASSVSILPAPPAASMAPALPVSPVPARKFLIQRLELRFDELVLADYSGETPDLQDHHLSLDQHYENVTSGQQLLVPDVLRRVAAENLGPVLARLIPGDFGAALAESARAAAESSKAALETAGGRATDFLHGLREKLEEKKKP